MATIIRRYQDDWILDENLAEICEALEQQKVPIPKTWHSRSDGKSHTWSRAFQNYPTLVIKSIKDRCKAAEAAARSLIDRFAKSAILPAEALTESQPH